MWRNMQKEVEIYSEECMSGSRNNEKCMSGLKNSGECREKS